MSVPPKDPLGTEKLSESSKLAWTHKALAMDHFRRFADLTIARNRDERVLFPHILFGLYVADKAGNKLSKADVCRLAEIDRATTGKKYIARLVDLELVSIRTTTDDRRKHFVVPTKKLIALVETQLLPRAAKLFLYLISPPRP